MGRSWAGEKSGLREGSGEAVGAVRGKADSMDVGSVQRWVLGGLR